MTAEIISVGTELLLGNILNTNAQYLSRELADLGITVQRESTIGDNHGRLADFVNEAKSRCDLLVFTGGLGPTADDLTKETVAACFGDELAFDEAEWDKITSYFARTGRETTPNNRKQAMVPTKGHKIINNHGTAPGAWFEQDGRCAVLMPGVPHEMKAMWTESVRPLLMERQNCTLHSVTLRVLGGESDIEYKVRDLLENPNPTAAIYCKTGECEIRITARARSDEDGEKMCRAYAKKFYDMLGDAVYDEDVAGLEETVVAVICEAGVVGLLGQTLDSLIVQAEVQDGVHHAGHGLTCAGTDGDQQRVLVVAEGLAGDLLEALDVLEDVSGDLVVDLTAVCVILGAGLGGDGEALRHRHTGCSHLSQTSALAAQNVLHGDLVAAKGIVAFAEVVQILFAHACLPPKW